MPIFARKPPPPPPKRRDRDARRDRPGGRELKTFKTVKPEVIDPEAKRVILKRHVPPPKPAYVRFMERYSLIIVFLFVLVAMGIFDQIRRNAQSEFEVAQFGAVSTDTLELGEIQTDMNAYLGFMLLMEFQHGQEREYDECAVAYKILGGVQDAKTIELYAVASYECGHHEDGEWVEEDKVHYAPLTARMNKLEGGGFSADSVYVLPVGPHITGLELTVEDVSIIMPENFAKRAVNQPATSAQLQADVDRLLGRIW